MQANNTPYIIGGGMVARLVGILSTSVLPEYDREMLLDKIPFLYQGEASEMHAFLMENQLCPMTQLAQFSNKGVKARLDFVMLNDEL